MTLTLPRPPRIARWVPLAGTALALLVWSNVVVPELPGAPAIRAACNVGVVAALVGAVRLGGISWPEMGICRTTWRRGARWGGVAVATSVAIYATAIAVPITRPLVAGADTAGAGTGDLLLRAAVIIPIGTVLCEELLFRGVLYALARRVLGERSSVVIVASVFALWHLAVALTRPVALPPALAVGSAAVVLVVTGLGGLLLTWARHHTGSLLTPLGVHLGTNAIGLLAVLVATR